MTRVAIYCRVSTSDQDVARQERDLVEYAARAGYEVAGVFKETLSGIRKARGKQPVERARVMALAQRREIDAVLVTELTRWGRSTQDLMNTLGELSSWDVSLIAQTGLTFDLSTPQGKLIASLMASLAEFEHDLLRERVRSGIAAAKARGQVFGRVKGYRPSDRHAPEVLRLADEEKLSQRDIAERLGISRTTVGEILRRRAEAGRLDDVGDEGVNEENRNVNSQKTCKNGGNSESVNESYPGSSITSQESLVRSYSGNELTLINSLTPEQERESESVVSPRPSSSLEDFFSNPPDWLATQLGKCRTHEKFVRPTCSSAAYAVFGTAARWAEVEPVLRRHLAEKRRS